MDNIEQLKVRYQLNKCKNAAQLDALFHDDEFLGKFASFLHGKIGQIWLNSKQSNLWRQWQGEA